MEEDGCPRTIEPFKRPCDRQTEILARIFHSTHGFGRTKINFEVDELTDFRPWTVRFMNEIGPWTGIIISAWTSGLIVVHEHMFP